MRKLATQGIGELALAKRIGILDPETADALIHALIDAKEIHEQVDRFRLQRGIQPDFESLLHRSPDSDRLHQNRFEFVK